MKAGIDTLIGVDLDLFLALHLLLDERSVTRAARRARVSQPTMSRWLQGLRDLTSDPILVREGRRMVPTVRALAVRHQLAEALSGLEAVLEGRPFFDPAVSERSLCIGVGDFAAGWVIPGLFQRLHARAPRMSLRVVPPRGDHDDRLATGEIDVLVARADLRLDGVERLALIDERFVGVAAPGHAFAASPPTLEAWLAAPHVILDALLSPGEGVEAVLRAHGASGRVVVRQPYVLALPHLLASLGAVSAATGLAARRLEAAGQVVTFPLPVRVPGYTTELAWSTARDADPVVAFLRDLVVAEVRHVFGAHGVRA